MIVGALGAALFALDRAKKYGAEQAKSMKTENLTPTRSS
jgi:hypothetical protein